MKTYFHHRYRKKALCLPRDTVFGTKNKYFYLPLGHNNKHTAACKPQSLPFKIAGMGFRIEIKLDVGENWLDRTL